MNMMITPQLIAEWTKVHEDREWVRKHTRVLTTLEQARARHAGRGYTAQRPVRSLEHHRVECESEAISLDVGEVRWDRGQAKTVGGSTRWQRAFWLVNAIQEGERTTADRKTWFNPYRHPDGLLFVTPPTQEEPIVLSPVWSPTSKTWTVFKCEQSHGPNGRFRLNPMEYFVVDASGYEWRSQDVFEPDGGVGEIYHVDADMDTQMDEAWDVARQWQTELRQAWEEFEVPFSNERVEAIDTARRSGSRKRNTTSEEV